MDLGQRIRLARQRAGLSQKKLCGDVITRNMLSQIENGSAQPSLETLRYLSQQLKKPISYFLGEESASPNQKMLLAARTHYQSGNFSAAVESLAGWQTPDAIFDPEYYLLQSLCAMAMAQTSEDPAALLSQAAAFGRKTPYYTPDLERRRLLLSATEGNATAVANALPIDDRELLLRAQAAMERGDPHRCIQLLDAAEEKDALSWLLLRADAAIVVGDYSYAISVLHQAEAITQTVYAKLEFCYLQLQDYKMAYHYACKQR